MFWHVFFSLHTWRNILRLLCQAFDLESDGADHKCEARLIAEARHLNTKGKLVNVDFNVALTSEQTSALKKIKKKEQDDEALLLQI